MKLYDIRGDSLPVMEVFSTAIRALKDHVLKHVERGGRHIRFEEIKWVLTVPAIWTDRAKRFMRMSAEKVSFVFTLLYRSRGWNAVSLKFTPYF